MFATNRPAGDGPVAELTVGCIVIDGPASLNGEILAAPLRERFEKQQPAIRARCGFRFVVRVALGATHAAGISANRRPCA
jgi:hypothetical protein